MKKYLLELVWVNLLLQKDLDRSLPFRLLSENSKGEYQLSVNGNNYLHDNCLHDRKKSPCLINYLVLVILY